MWPIQTDLPNAEAEPEFLVYGFCIDYLYIWNEYFNTNTEFEPKLLDSAKRD